jgi:hypothetical protein
MTFEKFLKDALGDQQFAALQLSFNNTQMTAALTALCETIGAAMKRADFPPGLEVELMALPQFRGWFEATHAKAPAKPGAEDGPADPQFPGRIDNGETAQ